MAASHFNITDSAASVSESSGPVRGAHRSATVAGMLLGLGATFVFYLVAPWAATPFEGGSEFVRRYFFGHPLEYITSAMFFVGMGILLAKLRQLPAERRALRSVRALDESGAWSTSATEPSVVADWTSRMLAEQTDSWNRHLSSLQTGWAEALTLQSVSMAQALGKETQSTLELHRNSLSGARDLYAATLQQSTHFFTSQMQQTLLSFVERVDAWQNALQASSLSSAGQAEELHRLGRTMLQLTESEERLAHLQNQLNQNLQTLEVVATLEQTVKSLNAAVNVLTAKTALRVAA